MKTFEEYEIVTKWTPSRMLENMSPDTATSCALALECQRIKNEIEGANDFDLVRWHRLSIPVISRLFRAVPQLEGTLNPEKTYRTSVNLNDYFAKTKERGYQIELDRECDVIDDLMTYLGEFVKYHVDGKVFTALGSIELGPNTNILLKTN